MTPGEKVRERERGVVARRVMVGGAAVEEEVEEEARAEKGERATAAAWRRQNARSIQPCCEVACRGGRCAARTVRASGAGRGAGAERVAAPVWEGEAPRV